MKVLVKDSLPTGTPKTRRPFSSSCGPTLMRNYSEMASRSWALAGRLAEGMLKAVDDTDIRSRGHDPGFLLVEDCTVPLAVLREQIQEAFDLVKRDHGIDIINVRHDNGYAAESIIAKITLADTRDSVITHNCDDA